MKLKKSLLALTTAATVAVAGSTAAVAEDTGANNSSTPVANSSSQDQAKGSKETPKGSDEGDDNPDKNKPSKLATSSANFFGWTEKTEGLQKFKDVTALVTAVGALVAGIVTLANNFQKLGKLFK